MTLDIDAAAATAQRNADDTGRVWFVIVQGGEFVPVEACEYVPFQDHNGFWKPVIERVRRPPNWTYRKGRHA